MSQRRVRVQLQQLRLQPGHRLGPGGRAAQRLDHRVVRVEVAQIVRRHHAQVPDEVGGHPGVRRDARPRTWPSSSGSTSTSSRRTERSQVRWFRPTWPSDSRARPDPEQGGEFALEPDGHVAQADRAVPRGQQGAGDDAHRVGEVDDEGGGRSPTASPFGQIEHDRHGPERLGQAAGPRRLLPDAAALQRPGLVTLASGLAADPELEQDRVRALGTLVQALGPAHLGGVVVGGHDPGRDRPDHGQPVRVGVDQHQLLDLGQQPPDPVGELGRVGGSAADHRKLHENAFTSSGLVWATWQAASWPGRISASSGVTCAQVSMASGQRQRNRQPGVGSITWGGSPVSVSAPTASGARGSGTADSSSWVYGCLGWSSTSLTGPDSTIWPAYITISRSAT